MGCQWSIVFYATPKEAPCAAPMVLLRVPELRDNLQAVTGGSGQNGDMLAQIIKDWVRGTPLPDIASKYFMDDDDLTKAITTCGKNVFGKLTQTASWGLGALLSITGSELSEKEFNSLRNLPSHIYYGVNDDKAVILRLLGVPRTAATHLANTMEDVREQPLAKVREKLKTMDLSDWSKALGKRNGKVYQRVWQVLEGLD